MKSKIELIAHSVLDKMPDERIRVIAFDKEGWCIGDCFYGHGHPTLTQFDEWNPRGSWRNICWRFMQGEHQMNQITMKVAYWCELPSLEEEGDKRPMFYL